jgi:hypothetical protein
LDAFDYLRTAQNVIDGNGLTGQNGQAQTVVAIGYSLSIAGIALATRDVESAALLVSVLASAASVALLFVLARRWFGDWVAVASTLLFVFFPLRIWMAQAILSESLAVVLLLAAVWLADTRGRHATARGMILGVVMAVAVMTRPEALATVPLLVVLASLRVRDDGDWLRPALASALTFMVALAPYVLWLHANTGMWSLTGKTNDFAWAIAKDRYPRASDLQLRYLAGHMASPTPGDWIRHYMSAARTLADRISANVGKYPLADLLLLVGLWGAVRRAVSQRAWVTIGFQLVLLAPLAVLPVFWIEDRYITEGAPLLALWIGAGAVELGLVFRRAVGRYVGMILMPAAVSVACVTVLLASYVHRLDTVGFSDSASNASRAMGQVVRAHFGHRDMGEISDFPGVGYFGAIRHQWLLPSNLRQLRSFGTRTHSLLVVASQQGGQTAATRSLLTGSYYSGDARLMARVHDGNLQLALFLLRPCCSASTIR